MEGNEEEKQEGKEMNLQDRIMELLLAAFDRFMDRLTFGAWTRVRGSVRPNIVNVKEMEQ